MLIGRLELDPRSRPDRSPGPRRRGVRDDVSLRSESIVAAAAAGGSIVHVVAVKDTEEEQAGDGEGCRDPEGAHRAAEPIDPASFGMPAPRRGPSTRSAAWSRRGARGPGAGFRNDLATHLAGRAQGEFPDRVTSPVGNATACRVVDPLNHPAHPTAVAATRIIASSTRNGLRTIPARAFEDPTPVPSSVFIPASVPTHPRRQTVEICGITSFARSSAIAAAPIPRGRRPLARAHQQ